VLLGHVIQPPVFASAWEAASSWFSADLVNAVLILPVMLSAPEFFARLASGRHSRRRNDLWEFAPVVALLVSLIVCAGVGGPGSLGFVVPALLWCALSYSLFISALLTLLSCVWLVVAVSLGLLPLLDAGNDSARTLSLRLGITLFAFGPLIVASINRARNRELATLRQRADHDILTGTLSRRSFTRRAEALLRQKRGATPLVVMMLDLDHFKQVNDRHGHAMGDEVLRVFATSVKRILRQDDLFGRLGGEEFALVLPGLDEANARGMAERIRQEIAGRPVRREEASVTITLSIGLLWLPEVPGGSLEPLLSEADRALYRAKAEGRDRVVMVSSPGRDKPALLVAPQL
jgi:diguanylate cyclase (GGDEF)-like protein